MFRLHGLQAACDRIGLDGEEEPYSRPSARDASLSLAVCRNYCRRMAGRCDGWEPAVRGMRLRWAARAAARAEIRVYADGAWQGCREAGILWYGGWHPRDRAAGLALLRPLRLQRIDADGGARPVRLDSSQRQAALQGPGGCTIHIFWRYVRPVRGGGVGCTAVPHCRQVHRRNRR